MHCQKTRLLNPLYMALFPSMLFYHSVLTSLKCWTQVLSLLTLLLSVQFTETIYYPTFTKLKTLLLNEWCLAADFRALICILQHSPILEELTIHLDKVHPIQILLFLKIIIWLIDCGGIFLFENYRGVKIQQNWKGTTIQRNSCLQYLKTLSWSNSSVLELTRGFPNFLSCSVLLTYKLTLNRLANNQPVSS